jgi:hypothetical protein
VKLELVVGEADIEIDCEWLKVWVRDPFDGGPAGLELSDARQLIEALTTLADQLEASLTVQGAA